MNLESKIYIVQVIANACGFSKFLIDLCVRCASPSNSCS